MNPNTISPRFTISDSIYYDLLAQPTDTLQAIVNAPRPPVASERTMLLVTNAEQILSDRAKVKATDAAKQANSEIGRIMRMAA